MEAKSIDTKEELRQTIIKRRHARGAADIKPEFREPEYMELTQAEKEKKERRREQNRRAAQRCRSKKRHNQNKVLQNFEKILENNNVLRHKMQALERERDVLRQRWHKHEEMCPVLSHIRQNPDGIAAKKEPICDDVNGIVVKKEVVPPNDHHHHHHADTNNTVLKASDVNTSASFAHHPSSSSSLSCPLYPSQHDLHRGHQLGNYNCTNDTENSPMYTQQNGGDIGGYGNANNSWYPQNQCINYHPVKEERSSGTPVDPQFHQQRQLRGELHTQVSFSHFLQSPPYPTSEQQHNQRDRSKTYPGLNNIQACNTANGNLPQQPNGIQRYPEIPPHPASQQQSHQNIYQQTSQVNHPPSFIPCQQQPFIAHPQHHQQSTCTNPSPLSVTIDKSKSNKYPDIRRLLETPCQAQVVSSSSSPASTPLTINNKIPNNKSSNNNNNNKATFNACFTSTIFPPNGNTMQMTSNENGIQVRPRPNSNGYLDAAKSDIVQGKKVNSVAVDGSGGSSRPRSQSGDATQKSTCRFSGDGVGVGAPGNRLRHISMSCSISIEEPQTTRRMDCSRMSSVSSDASSIQDSATPSSAHRDDHLSEVNEAEVDEEVFSPPMLHELNPDEPVVGSSNSPLSDYNPFDLKNNNNNNNNNNTSAESRQLFDSPASEDRRTLTGRVSGFAETMETDLGNTNTTADEVHSFLSLNNGDIVHDSQMGRSMESFCDDEYFFDDQLSQIPDKDLIFYSANNTVYQN